MQIHIFQSQEGDCLMVEDDAGQARLLSDGGTPGAMRDGIAAALAAWQEAGKDIDLLCVSHIDSDHIGGVALLLDLAVQWKVFDFHQRNGDPSAEPTLPRPPAIKTIWHNAFRDLITSNAGRIESLLAASAPLLQASRDPGLADIGHAQAQIATSIKEALTVSRLIKPELLGIGLNTLAASPQHSGKLLMARPGQAAETLGDLKVTVLCPTAAELRKLREGWNNWLRSETNRQTARKIRDLYAGQLENGTTSLAIDAFQLFDWQGVPDYKQVTVPNVASTVLLVEEAGQRLLLTGDSHPDMIIDGLERAGLVPDGHIHLEALKFQHHGSDHNLSDEFPRMVSADHYLFCGDGSHSNPELSVLEAMFAARLGPAPKRARSPRAAGRPFKFWFSTSPEVQAAGQNRDHMLKVVRWAQAKLQQHPGHFDFHFGVEPFTTLVL
ncbi:beta-lactamase superfamily II metal-dependent hydrolase [Pelomonas aquatica]|uniref:Beta-lactamase superfamily II metal-dependent hydrolase n=1 Tax=Pelomonas aquatica TaxID=431058 RepID=A0ABU1ZCX9_9BURK|nr:MBL fold metallo-hydrolase [Pelomonas aquatica]MDR7297840.1 beta-lactamase superfamily II metal-dependent hydrolase [Pelomonas aquatica]